jgi:3',5'-cyclic AMP phosphodiesterase CpdA
MLIAQISDFHVTARGALAYGRVDTAAHLAAAVRALNALPMQPDLVVGTGDLTQHGRDDEYAILKAVLADLRAPFLPVMGNHDVRDALLRAFPEVRPASGPDGFVQYTADAGPLRIVVVDTVTEGSDEPSFCEARRTWLEGALAEDDRPTLIAGHHPPFRHGLGWLEPRNDDWAVALAEAMRRAPHVRRLIAGHVHRAIQTLWAGVEASSAPGTAHQVALDLSDRDGRLSMEAPGFQLHRWTGSGFVTYTASLSGLHDTFDPTQPPQ